MLTRRPLDTFGVALSFACLAPAVGLAQSVRRSPLSLESRRARQSVPRGRSRD